MDAGEREALKTAHRLVEAIWPGHSNYRCMQEAHAAIDALVQAVREAVLESAAARFDGEEAAARLHAVYQKEAHRRGDVRHPDDYNDLSEATKEWDRVLAKFCVAEIHAVAAAIKALDRE